MRVGILGSASAIGAHGFKFVFETDRYLSATIGGAITAVIANQLPFLRFSGLSRIAAIGAISGYTGRLLSEKFAPDTDPDEDVPFRALLGLVLGGGVGALSADGISPPEIKLLS